MSYTAEFKALLKYDKYTLASCILMLSGPISPKLKKKMDELQNAVKLARLTQEKEGIDKLFVEIKSGDVELGERATAIMEYLESRLAKIKIKISRLARGKKNSISKSVSSRGMSEE
ncbi:hypothetical protein [Solidesulfovibrio sp.]|uniref:hypothetical protein n=1 Tax=Solidesulfovibrio sp. TaxID=2910990 RepID=UPI0026132B71|nr:hypothetical protein [Solidesulfovibrio sp.]